MPMTVLASTRRTPCCHRHVRFRDLFPCERKCRSCGSRYFVTFASAVGAACMTGREVWKAVWVPRNGREVA